MFRKHKVSLYIQFKVVLLQMDILKSTKVMIGYDLANEEKGRRYLHFETMWSTLYDEARFHYENYYPNKKFLITSLKIVGEVNRNKLYPFLKSN